MSAHLDFEKCPVCGQVRNSYALTKHIKREHGAIKVVGGSK